MPAGREPEIAYSGPYGEAKFQGSTAAVAVIAAF